MTSKQAAHAIIRKALESAEAWYEPRSEASNGGIVVDLFDDYVTFPGGLSPDVPDSFEMTISATAHRHEINVKCLVTLEFPFDIGDEIDESRAIIHAEILNVERAY